MFYKKEIMHWKSNFNETFNREARNAQRSQNISHFKPSTIVPREGE
jgi:hypothetical protein